MKKMQSGRSMIEMLGVLAIASILALFGIYWYTTAMNKYKAIEILEEAQKRAAIVASYIGTGGQGDVEIRNGEEIHWYTTDELEGSDKIYSAIFSSDVAHARGKIYVELDVPEGICDQMKAVVAQDGREVIAIERDCKTANDIDNKIGGIAVVFNDDMDFGAGTTACTTNDDCFGCQSCDPDTQTCHDDDTQCPGGTTCANGTCICNEKQIACGLQNDDTSPYCCPKNYYCVAPENTMSISDPRTDTGRPANRCFRCRSNSDCKAGQYCYAHFVPGACDSLMGGSCSNIPSLTKKQFHGKNFYYNTGLQTWLNCRNICEAAGHRLVTLEDLEVSPAWTITCLEQKDYCEFFYADLPEGTPKPTCAKYDINKCRLENPNCQEEEKLPFCRIHWLEPGETCPKPDAEIKRRCYRAQIPEVAKTFPPGPWWTATLPADPCKPYWTWFWDDEYEQMGGDVGWIGLIHPGSCHYRDTGHGATGARVMCTD